MLVHLVEVKILNALTSLENVHVNRSNIRGTKLPSITVINVKILTVNFTLGQDMEGIIKIWADPELRHSNTEESVFYFIRMRKHNLF